MKQLAHFFSYPLSVLFYLFFGILLLVFHLIQWLAFNLLGYTAHKYSVEIMNALILILLRIVGTSIQFKIPNDIPKNTPLIIVSNHQSLWDIPPMVWFLRKLHPKFISKIELQKGIPSVSYNLRHGGSVLIDRNKPEDALRIMNEFAQYINSYKRAGVIFPEGTRSRDGRPKKFKKKGLQTLFEKIPNGYVLPITINNSWKMQRNGMFPIPLGVRLDFKIHPAICISDHEIDALIDKIEEQIVSNINWTKD
jgi:1-acyl-sn-glycerol-3-phosphate acyltransferase